MAPTTALRCCRPSVRLPGFPVGNSPLDSSVRDEIQLYSTASARRADTWRRNGQGRPIWPLRSAGAPRFWTGGPFGAGDKGALLGMGIAWGAAVGPRPANPRGFIVVPGSEDSAAEARVTTVHCVSTSQLGAGHGPGVLAHRRGHLLLL